MLSNSESFGVQDGYGKRVVEWINEYASKNGLKLEARLYGHAIQTQNFGAFEMFSWMGNVKAARQVTLRASKRFHIRVIEGGYKTRDKMFSTDRTDYAMVREGQRVLGKIKFKAPLLGNHEWRIDSEEMG